MDEKTVFISHPAVDLSDISQTESFSRNGFLIDPNKELMNISQISAANRKTMNDLLEKMNKFGSNSEDPETCKKEFIQYVSNKWEKHNTVEFKTHKLANITKVCRSYEKKHLALEAQLKNMMEIHEKQKLEKGTHLKELRSSQKHLHYAADFYAKQFQYDVNIENSGGNDTYHAIVTFYDGTEISKHPIKFTFDRSSDKLISFDAGTLLTEEETVQLQNENYLCYPPRLFSRLRNAALKKHTL